MSGNEIGMPAPSLSKAVGVQAVFDDHERRICQLAKSAYAVVGCVAWVTNQRILTAFAECPCGVSVVLHHDEHASRTDKIGLDTEAVPPMSVDCDGPEVACDLPYVTMRPFEENGRPAMLHAKFLVFCDVDVGRLVPSVVWVGSANLTNNATRNIEAGVVIVDPVTARAFASTWRACLAFAVGIPARSA